MSATAPVGEQLAAARAGGAICARDELAFVRVSGRDAARLLQNVVTSDVDALAVGEGQYGLALTPKGKPLADAWIVREAEDAFVCACEAVAQDDLSGNAAPLPARLARRHRAGERTSSPARAAARAAGRRLARRPARCAPAGRARRRAGGLGRGARRRRPCRSGAETRETLRIEQGLPRFGVDFDGANLPAEAGVVERAVSFTKGCYIGQEPIVRLAHRGHANRELRRLRLATPVALPATLLEGEREVGRVTSSAEPAGRRRRRARLRPRGRSPTARSWSRSTPAGSALPLWTLVEWPQGARSSGDRAQPCGG